MSTPRTHPKPGDTYTDATGVTKALSVPDATGRVRVRFPDGRTVWAEEWGFWSEGTYERRNPKYDPRVDDTKTYTYPWGEHKYVVISTDPLRYVYAADAEDEAATVHGMDEWTDVGYGTSCVYACGDDS